LQTAEVWADSEDSADAAMGTIGLPGNLSLIVSIASRVLLFIIMLFKAAVSTAYVIQGCINGMSINGF
jgi:hypothetical protein